jgi:hypothetical protein
MTHVTSFSNHIYFTGKTVGQTRDLWKVSEMSHEKVTTCMSHKPCHTSIINNSESEIDFDSDNEDDDP